MDAGQDRQRISGECKNRIREVRYVTFSGLVINLFLSTIKCICGVLGSSQALIADSVHSLSDSVTDITVLVGAQFWSAPPDETHPYGHGRIETFVTFFIGIVLGGVGIGLAYRAIVSLHEQVTRTPGWLAFAAACLSIALKEWLYRWNIVAGKRIGSNALIANAWHHRSDALSSVPVAMAVIISRIWPAWGFLDHIATVIVAVLILHAAWRISYPAFEHLIDAGASIEVRQTILAIAMDTKGVDSVHALRTRHVGPGLQIDLHIEVDPNLNVRQSHDIARSVKERLMTDRPEIIDVIVHVEPSES